MTLVNSDIAAGTLKVEAAKRRILEINPRAKVEAYPCRRQDRPKELQTCDLIFGCFDSFSERQQLEALAGGTSSATSTSAWTSFKARRDRRR
jgi:molybdopterin/thiamine biosynthesis adenylyltransferase